MKSLQKDIRSGIIIGLSFLSTISIGGILYAAIGTNWTNPTTLEVGAGSGLTSSSWNAMLADFNNLDARSVPTGAVMAFYGTACPNGWAPADGTTNGVKKTDGTLGTLDLRGEFIRGLDTLRGVDPSRTLGSGQSGSLITTEVVNNGGVGMVTRQDSQTYSDAWPGTGLSASWVSGTIWTYANPYIRTVRPRNVALLYCVKN